ncbi:MAG: hypothetical protein EP315_01355 [Gammaproteobacteria bacterium]|nr:MAG: hypothetical protein EP315_01355 [Gammaproteobacteria bacterium]
MTEKRNDDTAQIPDRIERTYNIGDRWYFELRGGGQKGPFDSKEEMEKALEEFISLQQEMKQRD